MNSQAFRGMKDKEGWPVCPHGYSVGNCKDCQVQAMHDKKQARKGTPIKALKNRSEQQERLIAKGYVAAGFPKARRQAMSGAMRVLPGDVDPGSLLLVEAKQTRSGKLVVEPKWMEQVEQQSKDLGRAGFYALHGWVAKGTDNYKRVVMVSEPLWFAILTKWNEETPEIFQEPLGNPDAETKA